MKNAEKMKHYQAPLLKNLYLLMIYKRLNMKPFKWFSSFWNLEGEVEEETLVVILQVGY